MKSLILALAMFIEAERVELDASDNGREKEAEVSIVLVAW